MLVQKTVKAKLVFLTASKAAKIKAEFINFQKALRGENARLYSATAQQAQRLRKRLGRRFKRSKEYSLVIRNDCFKVKENGNKLFNYWAKVPVCGKSVHVAVAFPYKNKELLFGGKTREVKLLRKGRDWFLNICVEKEVPTNFRISSVLSCDLGERRLASTVLAENGGYEPEFYGREVRGIRRHFSWLRARLQEKKLFKKLKQFEDKEKKAVKEVCHRISKAIVEKARKNNSVILLGELNGIRNSARGKGKRFNRIVSNMPFNKLSSMIEYKAAFQGIPVVKLSEWDSSKTCHVCNSVGNRKTQGLFVCPACGLEYNADLNGALNLWKRFSGHVLGNSVVFDTARNEALKEPDGLPEPRISRL